MSMPTRQRRRRAAHPAVASLAPLALAAALAAALATPLPALAQDIAWSGFATLGYARSGDAPGRYLRWIDSDGSFNPDSVAALQADWRLNPRWSATVHSHWASRPSGG